MMKAIIETVGCDLGDKRSELYVIGAGEEDGRSAGSIPTTVDGLERFFRKRAPAHVVIEVGTHSRWVSKLLKQWGHRVTVANARKLQLISRGLNKSDVVDAEVLARLGRADPKLLSPVQHRNDAMQADLAVVKARGALVDCRTKLVNQIRSVVKSFGHRLPSCSAEAFHNKTRQSIPAELAPALVPLYETLTEIHRRIRQLEATLVQVAKKNTDVEVVSQPAGVGLLTALTFILVLEDKTKFKSRDVGAFLGLCPRRDQSGGSDPQLRITKAGSPLLRRLLVQSANYTLGPFGPDSDLRQWGLRLCERGGKNARKRAVTAVARKLSVLMHRLWVTGEVYEPIGYAAKHIAKAA